MPVEETLGVSPKRPMKNTTTFAKRSCHHPWRLILGASAAGSLLAGTLTTDFNTDPGGLLLGKAKIENGILKLQDLQELLDGTSSLPMHGSYVFPEIDPGQKVAAFTASFRVSIHGGTETPAQGFSFVLAPDLATRTAPFREGGGDTTGLVISFDTVDNLPGFEAEGNEPGDAPGIIVKLGGQRVTARRFAGLRTGPPNNQTPNFVPVEIRLEADGTLNVTYNGVKVLDNVSIPYAPIAGQFGVGAGTAELTAAIRANHWFDNMSITTTPVTTGPVLLSALPLGTQVRPDALVEARIENLGGATVQLEFDGATVTPSVSTSAGVTTVSYDPPGLLAAGSSHQVKLTYGTRTLRWSFTVMNVPTLPANFALEAGAVDTTRGGFKVRIHQLEGAAPGGNSYQRAIRQLAGELGPNVADLSLANPDGTFDRDLINFEQDGNEAGFFSWSTGFIDELFPGIPGTTGSTDNIAMEVTGFLELAPGVYTFGMVSDDNARLTIGPHPRDLTGLIVADTTIGTVRGTLVVTQAGLYPFSLVWAEGVGGAHVELWTEDATGRRVLVNDRNTAGHVKAYRQLRAGVNLAPYLSRAKPAPGDGNVSTTPRLELELTEEGSTVKLDSIRLSLNGQPVTLGAGAVTRSGNKVTITHRVSDPLEGLALQTVRLEYTDSANRAAVREYTFTTGAPQTGGFAGGQWDFERGDLSATLGRPLGFIDPALASRYRFGTTTQFGIPGINGREARVLHIPHVDTGEADAQGPIFKRLGLRARHGIPPNGGGQKVNQWTWIMDLMWGENGSGFGSILQTHDFDNPTDGDLFWRASDGSYGKGCCSPYDGISQEPGHNHRRGEWARVVFVVDLASTPRKVAKYVNGHKHREDVTGDGNALDSRFALSPEVFLFGDGDDNERSEAYVNSIQIRAGTLSDEEVAALGGPSADGIPLPFAQWDFEKGSLAATVGQDLGYIDASLASRYRFGTTTQLGIPGINGREARVLHIPHVDTGEADARGPIFKRLGLRLNHGLGANGGGQKLNQYTLIMDLYWGQNGSGFGSILQTHDFDNPTDGDLFWRASDGSYGKGCCSPYDGISQEPGHNHRRGEWARVVFVVDLASTPRKVAKYVNGHKHREDVTGDGNALDSRFALPPEVFLFGDGDDNERSEAYVAAMQFREGTLTDEEVAALGGPSPYGIPWPAPAARRAAPPVTPTITVQRSGANVVLTWTGVLQSADRVEGPYSDVSGASSPLTVPTTGAAKFYRARR